MEGEVPAIIEHYARRHPFEEDALLPLFRHVREQGVGGLFDRRTSPGHVTAGAVVVARGVPGRLLVVEHRVLKLHLFPGGHCEADEPPRSAAIRELREEVGIEPEGLEPASDVPFDIDCHVIPENAKKREPAHWHYDFRYLFFADASARISLAAKELVSACWVPIDGLTERHHRVAEKLRSRLGSA